MARVLVTGGTGFIGAHLLPALQARNHEVTCLVRGTSAIERLQGLDVRSIRGDVTDRDSLAAAVRGHEIVFHLAGCVRALRTEELYRVNAEGARNVASACADQTTPPILVSVSSLAAAGPTPNGRPRVEADPPAPVSDYGRSKRAGELAAQQWADRVPITIARPSIVFGESDRATLGLFAPVARFGVHPAPGSPEFRVPLIHADDLANLLVLAAERGRRLVHRASEGPDAGRGYYFAACEQTPTYAELGRMIGTALGRRRVRVVPVGRRATWTVAATIHAFCWLRRRPWYFNLDKAREALAGSWACSTEAAARDLGFATAAGLPERLRQAAQWYREHYWL